MFLFLSSPKDKKMNKQGYRSHDRALGSIILHLIRNHFHSEKTAQHIER